MLRNRRDAFGWGTIALHWSIALLIIGLIVLGYVMTRPDIDPALQFDLFQWHKSFGFTALALSAIRVIWWLANAHPAPVAGLSAFEKRASTITHWLLVGLTITVPMAGWALASTSTLGIPTFFFNRMVIPHLPMEKSAGAEAFWTNAHAILAYGLAALVLLHAAAALYHHFLRRDTVLLRMLRNERRER
ncbi:cytochrome b [Rhizobium herbae]|uniref:Cytochrome b561 n=1 Tax=Rhizobium herbae TaxID=508661 RepID=A0ABS4EF93_9HYPH|nr:cytochrome b [Rhizobium herbae]MBP1856613.1 cytochrome b561 [Rhizobium herbae]